MMEEVNVNLRDILVKKPFTRIMSTGAYDHGYIVGEPTEMPVCNDKLERRIVTQQDFRREYDPLGHAINNRELYPDIWRLNDEDGKWYIQEVPRYAIAYQQIILVKQLTHLCGNDIRFELSDKSVTDKQVSVYIDFVTGWANKNMEVAWYNLCHSVKSTGDGAIVGYMDNGKFGYKNLSFNNGDVLYPHYDKYTGKMSCFARKFADYGEKGQIIKNYVEVWDDKFYYRFSSQGSSGNLNNKVVSLVKGLFKMNGYELEEQREHYFPFVPVAYHRDDLGPCWTPSQETIENYEATFSNLAHSNHEFGLPIMYVRGEGSEEISSQDMSYASKIMFLPSDGEVGFLNRQDASNAYNAELTKLEELIYKQSHVVKTPELKSGDTPGVALKIMYSDAFEKAMNDAHEFDNALDTLVEMFSFGYGTEIQRQLDFKETNIRHYIEPYIHLNTTEMTTNLNTAVIGGFLSKQTASEKCPYATPNEWERICKENKERQMQDLLLQEARLDIQTEAAVEQTKQVTEIQTEQQLTLENAQEESEKKEDEQPSTRKKTTFKVATGRNAGRPSTTGRTYDENRNWEGRNNWDKWNATR